MHCSMQNNQLHARTQFTELYRREQIRSIESEAKQQLATGTLMRAAGKAAAELALELLGAKKGKVLILAGVGDNGGDALETAHLLCKDEVDVHILLLGNTASYSVEANQSLQQAHASKAKWISIEDCKKCGIDAWDLIIDGLFGIGLNRPIEGDTAELIEYLNRQNSRQSIPTLALDIPSGLNVDTGQIFGDNAIALRATHTLTFIGNKIGLHTAKAKDFAGQVFLNTLNLDHTDYPPADAHLLTESSFDQYLPRRRQDSHKGSYGEVLILGGNSGMLGAPILAGRAALMCGAGKVHLGMMDERFPSIDIVHPELMIARARSSNLNRPVVVIGPGLGTSEEAKYFVQKVLEESPSLIIDADALNVIAIDDTLKELVRQRAQKHWQTLITPHPLEAARLLQTSANEIQSDRCKSAQKLAQELQVCVVLKGAGTVIVDSMQTWINSSGNAGLASAGTGDVLSGICGALLAQGLNAAQAACLAVYLHGKAADLCVENGVGPVGLTASELIPAIRSSLNDLLKR